MSRVLVTRLQGQYVQVWLPTEEQRGLSKQRDSMELRHYFLSLSGLEWTGRDRLNNVITPFFPGDLENNEAEKGRVRIGTLNSSHAPNKASSGD